MATTMRITTVDMLRPPVSAVDDTLAHALIEDSFLLGYSPWWYQALRPVMVGDYVAEQAEISEVKERTGKLPQWLLTCDMVTKSYMSVHRIVWTPEDEKFFSG